MGRIVYTDQQIIDMIKSSTRTRNEALRWICTEEKWQLGARKMVLQCGVPDHDVEDVTQESLTSFTFNILKDSYQYNSQLATYYMAICRNVALKKMRKVRHHDTPEVLEGVGTIPVIPMETIQGEEQLKSLMRQLFARLKEGCRKILKWYAAGLSMSDIAEEMGFANPQSAKNKSKQCRDKLKGFIDEDPDMFNQLKQWI